MTAFDFATVAISFVLGLGVTHVLQALLDVFRARHHCRIDWLPLLWVGVVLVYQFQFWWAIYELAAMPSLDIGTFSLMLALAALLFLAGGLILPGTVEVFPEDLGEYFRIDGSWGVGAIALYCAVAVGANILLFSSPLTSPTNLLNVVATVLLAGIAVSRSRRTIIFLTVLFLPVFVSGMIAATPAVY